MSRNKTEEAVYVVSFVQITKECIGLEVIVVVFNGALNNISFIS
jgi:hypothetical protein